MSGIRQVIEQQVRSEGLARSRAREEVIGNEKGTAESSGPGARDDCDCRNGYAVRPADDAVDR